MAHAINHPAGITSINTESVAASSPSYQAYQILRFGFTVAPIVAGLDKFFHLLVNWGSIPPGHCQLADRRSRTPVDARRRRYRNRRRPRSLL